MREKNVTKIVRRRRAYLRRQKKAVSPVVATLILILVAVAAAAALYLWLVAWQGGVTKGIGSPTAQSTLTIGGSTTLYPGDQIAVQWFEQNNSNVVIANTQGGSGAGILALCAGQIDIAASSRALASTDIAACPALQTATQTHLGLSAVVVTLATTNAQGFTSESATSGFDQAVLASIYQVNGGGSGLISSPVLGGTDGLKAGAPSAACTGGVSGIAGKCYAWADIPNNWGSATCSTAGGSAGCTYGASASEIHIYGRADNGGTSETFVTKILGAKCGTDNQLQSCGVNAGASGGGFFTGNFGVGAALAADPLGLGYNDFGNIGSIAGVSAYSYQNSSQNIPVVASLTTIKAAAAGLPSPYTTGYGGWRQLEYITLGTPTGEALRFIQFVTGPQVDQQICAMEGWISAYS